MLQNFTEENIKYWNIRIRKKKTGVPGWLSQLSVRLLILAQVMISRFVGWSPVSVSVLTAQSLLGSLSLSLSLWAPRPAHSLHLSLKINKLKKIIFKKINKINDNWKKQKGKIITLTCISVPDYFKTSHQQWLVNTKENTSPPRSMGWNTVS